MKTIKPQKLSVLFKVFEDKRKLRMCVSIFVFFPFDRPQRLLPEVSMWKFLPEELGENVILDECMPKPQPEVLVDGYAYPPGPGEQSVCRVRLQLGNVDKQLYVVGDRHWEGSKPSDPRPFTQMRVDWAHAFGGEGFEDNPVGKGIKPVHDEEAGMTLQPLPNVENPRQVVASPRDKPEPAGFGYIDLTWPQRMRHAGHYDLDWYKTLFPGFAADFDWHFFNVAPLDQRLDALHGGEPFVIENMHPDKAQLEGSLPRLLARCFVNTETPEGLVLREVAMKPETVRLFPHAERGVMIYRGVIEVAEDDAADIKHMIIGADDVDTPRPASHYSEVLAQRLDKNKGWLLSFRDRDLLPPSALQGEPEEDEAFSDVEKLIASPGVMAKNIRSRAQLQLDQMRKDLIEQGVDPDEHNVPTALPQQEAPPDLENLASYMEEKLALMHEQMDKAKETEKEAEQRLRDACDEHGLDYDALLDKARREAGGPPKFRAALELERLHDQLELGRNAGVPMPALVERLNDPQLLDNLKKTEDALLLAYRKFAHHYPPAYALDEEPGATLRQAVVEAIEAGESLAGRDLTGAPLAEMNLMGADLSGAFLESADLRGCNLKGANIEDAVFARADLSGADLSGSKAARANFGAANLRDCDLGGSDCRETVFAKADLTGARFDGAQLESNDMMETRYGNTSFAGVSASKLMFFNSDMANTNLSGATIDKTMFIETSVADSAFDGSRMESSVFVKCRGTGATFRNARLHNFRVVHECDFAGADFHSAEMAESNFRGTNLEGSDFSEIQADSADFSECNLRGANFYRAHTPSSLWIRADLSNARMVSMNAMLAILQKANIEGADFTGANVFRADFARIKGNVGTHFKDANMNQIRFIDRGDHGQR